MSFCPRPDTNEVSSDSTPGSRSSHWLLSLWHCALSKTPNSIARLSGILLYETSLALSFCLIALLSGEGCTQLSKKPKLRSLRLGLKLLKKCNQPVTALRSALLMGECIKLKALAGTNSLNRLRGYLLSCAMWTLNQPGSRAAIAAGYKVIVSCCKGLSSRIQCRYGQPASQ